jgi:hypothetical protein
MVSFSTGEVMTRRQRIFRLIVAAVGVLTFGVLALFGPAIYRGFVPGLIAASFALLACRDGWVLASVRNP